MKKAFEGKLVLFPLKSLPELNSRLSHPIETNLKRLFDVGDNWEFDVQLEEIQPPNAKIKKPKILEIHGEAPQQYWDEEDDWEEDDE